MSFVTSLLSCGGNKPKTKTLHPQHAESNDHFSNVKTNAKYQHRGMLMIVKRHSIKRGFHAVDLGQHHFEFTDIARKYRQHYDQRGPVSCASCESMESTRWPIRGSHRNSSTPFWVHSV